jgi:hypothetical protein
MTGKETLVATAICDMTPGQDFRGKERGGARLSSINVRLPQASARLHTGFQFADSRSQAMGQKVVVRHS